jgi:hypothetical protein
MNCRIQSSAESLGIKDKSFHRVAFLPPSLADIYVRCDAGENLMMKMHGASGNGDKLYRKTMLQTTLCCQLFTQLSQERQESKKRQ